MNKSYIYLIILVFASSLIVSCKNTKQQKQTKVTKKSHLIKKSKIETPKKILLKAKQELYQVKKTIDEIETKSIAESSDDKPLQKMICVIPNGDGIKTWIENQEKYSECFVTSCHSGFVKWKNTCRPICNEDEAFHNGKCNPVIAQCMINGIEGEKVWDGDRYSPCISSEDFSISANHSSIK